MFTTGDILSIAFFLASCVILLLGTPIAFSLAGLSLMFAVLGHWFGVFDYSTLSNMPLRYFGIMTNEVLVAVPLFVLMGNVLERSGIAERLLSTMGKLFGTLPGGLGFSVIIVGALLAASTGVVGHASCSTFRRSPIVTSPANCPPSTTPKG